MPYKIADRPVSEAIYSVNNLPESDGKPMGETSRHVMLIVETIDALRAYFRDDPQMFIIGNVFVYFLDESGVLRRLAPDIFAVRGVGREERRVYSVESEGKSPEFVIEFTSKKTKKSDLVGKKDLYAWLGVKEYFLFDPFGEYLKPRLMGFRLLGGEYIPIPSPGKELRLHSDYLNLDLLAERGMLRFWNSRTRTFLLTYDELDEQRKVEAEAHRREAEMRQRETKALQREMEARQREAEARQVAEAEAARLREELQKLRQGKN